VFLRAISRFPCCLVLILSGCREPAPPPKIEARVVDASEPSDAASSASEPPLPDFMPLEVEGFASAVVSTSIRKGAPAPIVVAGHGNYDRPEWQCEVWRAIFHGLPFILCPRGIPRTDSPSSDDIRFTYANVDRYKLEIERGLAALRARFGSAVDSGPIVYVGFSLAALFGARLLVRGDLRAERAVLVEGGHSPWTLESARAFATRDADAGPKRVLFACGQTSCVRDAEQARKILSHFGSAVTTAVVSAPGVGHGYGGAVAERIAKELDWLVEGDARFRTPAARTVGPN
jgi:pimeloyl-ACP methyl ester carboxylesterase